jgi:CDP-6-deoxy-D-xylo-4-hexulose-3-dehydrase
MGEAERLDKVGERVDSILLGNPGLDDSESAEIRSDILRRTAEYACRAHAAKPFVPGKSFVPVSGKVYGALDIQSLVAASLDFWLTTGRFNEAFEKRLERNMGLKRAITVNSGSSANLLAVSALTSPHLGDKRLKPGDEVITAAAGFPTTVNPIVMNGLVPVFIDVDLQTYNISTRALETALSPRTRAIFAAHTLGNPMEMDRIAEFAEENDLFLIEDCCDAMGSVYHGKNVGTFGDMATLSFYPAHHITTGEGGSVLTSDALLAKIVESLRDWGRDCSCPPGVDNSCGRRFTQQLGELPYGYDHKYTYSNLGYNLKMTDMQAAVGLAQIERLPEFISKRKRNFANLHQGLSPLASELLLPRATPGSDPSWFGFPLCCRPNVRNQLLRHLEKARIGTRLLFAGNVIRQPYFRGLQYRVAGDLVNTERIMKDVFWIGVFPGITPEMTDFVCRTINEFFGKS